ncbi:hypothetical protein P5673_004810 [Acropora cervicornis]|uniref:Uncharacterized protein n=1 Tax=Acropora cervicornis TaxID=6130 RepID=A0AAD9VDL9_ACRCE|nr:hypothetical protein P5673_004810 [Acropora cervicornis]
MFTAMGITQASRKKAVLLHYVGEETCDVFETRTVPEPTDESDKYRTAVKAFADYFEPQKWATVNILSKKDFDGLTEKPQLLKTNLKVYPYMSSKPLNPYGKLRVSVTSDHRSSEETFYVVEGSSADEECIQEPPPAFESSNVPGPNSLDPPNTRHVKDDLPSSSNLVPVPVSQTQTSQSCDPPPLSKSSRRRFSRKILDL